MTKLILDYKRRNDAKIFHSSAKLTASDSDIDEAFKSMQQSILGLHIFFYFIIIYEAQY